MKSKSPVMLAALACLCLPETIFPGGAVPPPAAHADFVLRNARIWTVNPKQPEAEALAIVGARLVAVGSEAQIRPLIGKMTRVIDLQQRRVLPGFHDSHVHLLATGQRLSQVALKDAADEAEFGQRLREFDRKLPPGRWLLGGNWDHDRTFAGKLPTAAVIDKFVPDRPVFLNRYDGHMALVSSKVLKLAGISEDTPDPAGGVIYRRPGTRWPTGLLRDNAMGLITRLIPEPAEAEIAEAVRAALAEARRVGVTSIQDMDGSGPATRRLLLHLYQRMARSGQLTARIKLYFPLGAWTSLADIGVLANFGDGWVRIGSLKDFIDGSLGSSTAKFFEPYVNEPGSTGIFLTPLSRLRDDIQKADRAGLAVAVHAIGDRGNAELLDIFDQAIKKNGVRDRRFRIEHVQHLRPADYARFAELGVIASMQPYHAIDDGRWAEGRIGPKRCGSSYAFRSLLDAGARLAFGSDSPVAPLDPLKGIDAAVNRRTLDGKHPDGWFPRQRIAVAEAIAGYTAGSAYAASLEKDLGTLEVGKLADLVVLSGDILAEAERDRIGATKVMMTMVGGRVVFEQ
jgi:predicted amidohydrolase YtcJ